MFKKGLSAILVVALVFCLLPVSIFATNSGLLELDKIVAVANDVISGTVNVPSASGFCNNVLVGLTFDISKLEILTINVNTLVAGVLSTCSDLTSQVEKDNPNLSGYISAANLSTSDNIPLNGSALFTFTAKVKTGVVGIASFTFSQFDLSDEPYVVADPLPSITITGDVAENVAVTDFTAPVVGAAPDTTVTTAAVGIGNATIAWKKGQTAFSGDKFEASTKYTAVITVSPAEYYSFVDGTAFTVNDGFEGWTATKSGNDYVLTKDFTTDAASLTGITVKTDSAITTGYTDGDSFNTTGLVVSGTYSDGTTAELLDYEVVYTDPSGKLVKGDTKVTIKKGTFNKDVIIPAVAGKTVTADCFSFTTKSAVYTGADFMSSFTPATSVISGTVTYSFKNASNDVDQIKTVGEYKVYATVSGDAHYADAANVEIGTVSVVQAAIDSSSVKWTSTKEFTYDGTEHVVSLENIPETVNVTYTGEKATNAGIYTAKAFLTAKDSNYKVSSQPADLDWIVSKAAVTMTSADAQKVYDGQALTNNKVTAEGFVDGEGVASYNVTGTQTEKGESDNTFTFTLKEGTRAENYEITRVYGKLKVTGVKNKFTTISITGWTYGESANAPSAEAIFGGTITYTYSDSVNDTYIADVPSNAGTYYVKAVSSASGSYESDTTVAAFTIAKKLATASAVSAEKVYGENDPSLSAVYTGVLDADKTSLTAAVSRAAGEDVGIYDITVTGVNGTKASNYDFKYEKAAFTINRATPVLTIADPGTIVFDGQAVEAAASGKDLSFSYDGDGTVTVSWYTDNEGVQGEKLGTAPADAGTYWLGVSAAEGKNYSATAAEQTKKFVISPKQTAVVWKGEADTYTYNGKDQIASVSAIYKDVNDADQDCVIAVTQSASPAIFKNAGTYTFTVSITDGNYILTGMTVKEVSIGKAAVTLTSASDEHEYDGLALTNSTVSAEGFVDGEGATYTVTGSQTAKGESDNTFTYTLNEVTLASNYEITTVYGKLKVTGVKNKITALNIIGWTYGDSANDPVATAKFGGSISYTYSDSVDGTYVSNVPSNAGTYYVKAVSTSSDNYESDTTKAAFTISPKAVNVTADAKSKTYGDADPQFTYTATGLVGSDTLSGSLSRQSGEDAGSYAISQGALTNENNSNYSIVFTGENLTINKKAITVTISAIAAKTYGEDDPSTYDYETNGLVNSDVLHPTFARKAGEIGQTVGEYAVTATFSGDDTKNYNITLVDGKLTINKRQVSVTGVSAKDVKLNAVSVEADLSNAVVIGKLPGDTDLTVVTDGAVSFEAGAFAASGEAKVTVTFKLSGTNAGSYELDENTEEVVINVLAVEIEAVKETVVDKTSVTGDVDAVAKVDPKVEVDVTDSGLSKALGKVAGDANLVAAAEIAKAEAALKGETSPAAITDVEVAIEPYMDVKLKAVEGTSTDITSITLDIAPKYNVIAKGKVNEVDTTAVVEEAIDLTVTAPMDITIPVPSEFAANGEDVWIKHIHDGKTYYYKSVVENGKITFINPNGYSEFVLTTEFNPLVSINRNGALVYYEDYASALTDVRENETISLEANVAAGTKWTINRTTPFFVDKNGYTADFEVILIGAANYTVSFDAITNKITATYSAPYNPPIVPSGPSADTKPEKPTEAAIENPFTDVEEGEFFFDSVLWAYLNEITYGTTETTFEPFKDCSRAQMVTFIWRAEGSPKANITTCPFKDVDKDAFYYDALLWAYENGVAYGVTSTKFNPSGKVSRGQAITFLYRANGEPVVEEKACPFKDVA